MDGGGEGVAELYSTTLACRRVEQEDSRFRKIPFILYMWVSGETRYVWDELHVIWSCDAYWWVREVVMGSSCVVRVACGAWCVLRVACVRVMRGCVRCVHCLRYI